MFYNLSMRPDLSAPVNIRVLIGGHLEMTSDVNETMLQLPNNVIRRQLIYELSITNICIL